MADGRARVGLTSVAVGVVAGMVSVTLAVAMGALVFSGPLAAHRTVGIGLSLFGTAVVGLVVALRSSLPGMLAGTQDNTSAILALAAAAAASQVPPDQALPTVVAVSAVTAGCLGVVLLLVGSLRLGRLVRFLPFPVVAGLIAGTGLVIVVFSWGIITGDQGAADFFTTWLEGDRLVRWAPGVVLAAILLLGSRGVIPRWAIPAGMVGSIAAIYAWLHATGSSVPDAQASGLLIGSFPAGPVWGPDVILEALDAAWPAVVGQAGAIGTILLLVPVTILLSVGAIELAVRRDLDGDRELRAAGLGNLAAAFGGGLPGYHYVADTVLAARLAPPRRSTAIAASVTVFAVMLGGGPLLGLMPTSFIAALLLFIGATFVVEWTWDARARLPRDDMGVVIGILVVIALVGFLPGVAIGLGSAIVLFAIRSSRLEVVKYQLDGTAYRSRVDRAPEEQAALDRLGERILVLELQSYLFFGTAERLRRRVEERLAGGDPLDHLVLGFRHVTGIDSSAVLAFEKLARLAEANGVKVLLAGTAPPVRSALATLEGALGAAFAPDVDRAVETAEEALLAAARAAGVAVRQADRYAAVSHRFEEVILGPGDRLMTQGEPSNGLFLVRAGRVTVEMETESGPVRLRSMGQGALVGEVALYLGGLCTATVVADSEVEALRLSPEAFAEMQRQDPPTAAELNLLTAQVLAQRLGAADHMIERLLS